MKSSPTSRPRLTNSNIYNVDITTKFKEFAARLPAGTLVKDEQFTLFESVGALEIGDAKMDSGFGEVKELAKDFNVSQSWGVPELLWMMDEILCREVAWQMGYPLSQTLFTSYHIDSLLWPPPVRILDAQFRRSAFDRTRDPLLHTVFRSYCLAVIKSCDLVLQRVKSQHYYEEEDFATQLFNRDLLHRFSTESISGLVVDAIYVVESMQLEMDLQQDLLDHLRFRLDVLYVLGQGVSRDSVALKSATAHIASLSTMQVARKPVIGAFSARLQRQLASSVPPRPMITIKVERALGFWAQALRDLTNVFSVQQAVSSIDLLHSYQLFSSQRPQPSLYVRALLQSFLGIDDLVCGRVRSDDFIMEDLHGITLSSSPLSLLVDADEGGRGGTEALVFAELTGFLRKIERSFMNIFRSSCLNRCRARRTLCHAALEWDQIQVEAEDLDEELQSMVNERPQMYGSRIATTFSYPISSWVYHHKLMQLRLIIQLGFELSIYAPHEMCEMYWHLAYMCETHLMHLERISHFVSMTQNNLPEPAACTKAQRRLRQRCQETVTALYRIFSSVKATEAFARGLHRIYLVFIRLRIIRSPDVTYSTDQLRYEIRMRPFSHLGLPEPVEYSRFVEMCYLRDHSMKELLEQAVAFCRLAERAWLETSRGSWHLFPLADPGEPDQGFQAQLWTAEMLAISETIKAAFRTIDQLETQVNATDCSSLPSTAEAVLPQGDDTNCLHPFWIVPSVK